MVRNYSRLALFAVTTIALLLPACAKDCNFTLLGYSTAPNYDTSIKYIRVPIFENKTYRLGLENDLTKAIVEAIEKNTPYKVVQHGPADAELTGVIIQAVKSELLVNPLNEARQLQFDLVVEVTYKNLHTGEILSRPSRRPGTPIDEFVQQTLNQIPGLAPTVMTPPTLPGEVVPPSNVSILPPQALPPGGSPKAPPVTLRSISTFVPELGYSISTASDQACKRMAMQVINLMEKPW